MRLRFAGSRDESDLAVRFMSSMSSSSSRYFSSTSFICASMATYQSGHKPWLKGDRTFDILWHFGHGLLRASNKGTYPCRACKVCHDDIILGKWRVQERLAPFPPGFLGHSCEPSSAGACPGNPSSPVRFGSLEQPAN